MRRVFVRSLEEIEDSKKVFRNYLTFNKLPGQKSGKFLVGILGEMMTS